MKKAEIKHDESELYQTEMRENSHSKAIIDPEDDGATTRYTALATYRDSSERIIKDGLIIDVAKSQDLSGELRQ